MLIDDKGRLFGKWNIIDVLVIMFLLCTMPMFYYGYKIFTRSGLTTELPELLPTITLDKIEYERKQLQLEEFLNEFKGARKYFEDTEPCRNKLK